MINISMLAALFLGARVPGATAGTGNDYQLRDIDGQLHRPSDYRGRWLIINFRATWCPPCIAEMPELEKFYSENRPLRRPVAVDRKP